MIVIIVGMHRSGTSALAGLLHNSNILMGEDETFIPKPSKENIKGFYENYLFRRINDKIAKSCGYTVKSWDIDVPEMSANFVMRHKMKKIIKRYNLKYRKWGWKDPRNCLTLRLWMKKIEEIGLSDDCRILYIVRAPYSVAESMKRRKNTSFEKALKLWKIYNERALEAVDNFDFYAHFLTYERLCSKPLEVSKEISIFLEHQFDESIVKEFIDPRLNRSYRPEINNKVPKELSEVILRLRDRIIERTGS